MVNRVYGDYSIVLVPVGSVPQDEIYENTPEIVIDPKLIPALNDYGNGDDEDTLNQINENPFTPNGFIKPPPRKRRKLNDNTINDDIQDFKDNNIVLATASNGLTTKRRTIGHVPRYNFVFFFYLFLCSGFLYHPNSIHYINTSNQ